MLRRAAKWLLVKLGLIDKNYPIWLLKVNYRVNGRRGSMWVAADTVEQAIEQVRQKLMTYEKNRLIWEYQAEVVEMKTTSLFRLGLAP